MSANDFFINPPEDFVGGETGFGGQPGNASATVTMSEDNPEGVAEISVVGTVTPGSLRSMANALVTIADRWQAARVAESNAALD